MKSRDAWIIARQAKGKAAADDITFASDEFRPLAESMAAVPLGERQAVLDAFIDGRDDAAAIRARLVEVDPLGEMPEGTDEAEWGPIRLGEIPPAPPFPLDVLPEAAARLVREGSDSIGCPPDFIATAMLTAAAGTIGRSVVLELKPGYLVASSIFAACVGPPSNGKTPAFKLAMEGARKIEDALRSEHNQAVEQWENIPKDDRPPKPVPRRLVLDDATMEVAVIRLAQNPRGLIMARDELSALLLGMNQYKAAGKGSDRPVLLKVWSGDSITRDRVGDQDSAPIHCSHPCLSIIGGIPPDMLGALQDHKGASDGFVDRFLFCYPVPLPVREWSTKGVPRDAREGCVELLHRLRLREMRDEDGTAVSHVAGFTPDARTLWSERYNAFTGLMNDFGQSHPLAGALGKLKEYAGRLVLILACLEHAADLTVDPEAVPLVGPDLVDKAWRLVDYFKAHALRAHHCIRVGNGIGGKESVRTIVEWLRLGNRSRFTEHELKQHRRGIPPEDLAEALAFLTERNVVRPRETDPNKRKRGRPALPTYEVNPALLVSQITRNP